MDYILVLLILGIQQVQDIAEGLRDDPLIYIPFVLLLSGISVEAFTIRYLVKSLETERADAKRTEREYAERARVDQERLIATLINVQDAMRTVTSNLDKLQVADKRDVADLRSEIDGLRSIIERKA